LFDLTAAVARPSRIKLAYVAGFWGCWYWDTFVRI
jgi:hypothetical protein